VHPKQLAGLMRELTAQPFLSPLLPGKGKTRITISQSYGCDSPQCV